MRKKIGIVFIGLLVVFLSMSCNRPRDEADGLIYNGWWMRYDELTHFGHDGQIVETENFVIYSDALDLAERQRVAEELEEVLTELMDLLHITGKEEFLYTTSDRKLHIYLSMYLKFAWGGGFMDTYGFMLYSLHSPLVGWPYDIYDNILKHELSHVVGGLLAAGIRGDAWFIEGLAEYISELSGLHEPVTTRAPLLAWIEQKKNSPLLGNPVSYHTYDDVRSDDPEDPNDLGDHDPFFELAFRYLLDPEGLGRTWLDIKNIYLDMKQGLGFAQAFEKRMNISLAFYENNFFTLMMAYLAEDDSINPKE